MESKIEGTSPAECLDLTKFFMEFKCDGLSGYRLYIQKKSVFKQMLSHHECLPYFIYPLYPLHIEYSSALIFAIFATWFDVANFESSYFHPFYGCYNVENPRSYSKQLVYLKSSSHFWMDLCFVRLYINVVFCRSISWSYGFAVLSVSLFSLIFYFSLGSSKLHRLQLNKHQCTNLPLPKSRTRRRKNSTRTKTLQCWGLQRVAHVYFSSTSTLPPSQVIYFLTLGIL